MRNKIISLGLLLVLTLIISANSIFALSFNNTIVDSGNYSYTQITTFINISTINDEFNEYGNATNVTCYYATDGGETNGSAVLTQIFNTSQGQIDFSDTSNLTTINVLPDVYPIADVAGGYNISCSLFNSTDDLLGVVSAANITIDNTYPVITAGDGTYIDYTNISYANAWAFIYFNFTIAEDHNDTVLFELYNATDLINRTSFTDGTAWLNWTNHSGGDGPMLADDNSYIFNITVNDSAGNSNTSTYHITIDGVAPIPTLTSLNASQTALAITIDANGGTSGTNSTCWIEGDSSGKTVSGAEASQTLLHTSLSCGTSYSYQISCLDSAGNAGTSVSTSFSTSTCTSQDSSSGSGSGSTTTPTSVSVVEKTNTLSIVPETEAALSGFQEEMGVEEIRLRVSENASNVKLTVRKFDTQPSEISVPKTGNVHKYLQIETQNLANKLEMATLTIKVQRNWLADNTIDKANVALFKFNGATNKWDELSTVYQREDNTYYYYAIQLDSFSYFAVSEKALVEEEPEETEEEVSEQNLTWLWIVIGAVVLAAIIGGGIAAGRKKR